MPALSKVRSVGLKICISNHRRAILEQQEHLLRISPPMCSGMRWSTVKLKSASAIQWLVDTVDATQGLTYELHGMQQGQELEVISLNPAGKEMTCWWLAIIVKMPYHRITHHIVYPQELFKQSFKAHYMALVRALELAMWGCIVNVHSWFELLFDHQSDPQQQRILKMIRNKLC